MKNFKLETKCAFRPKPDNIVSSIPCCRRFHGNCCFKSIVFLVIFILDAADLASDWFLYHDIANTEEGLVYGPPDGNIHRALLAFCIIGTLTIVVELINLWLEIFRENPWLDIDLLSAITIWIEDVPQITINVFIAACREEAISYIQLVKASVVILGVIIRLIVSLFRYCSKKARHDVKCASVNASSRRHVAYRVVIMIGLILTFGGAVTVFMFTQHERNPDGSLNFKDPHSIAEGKYDDAKYFNNVSIYFSHDLFDWDKTPARSCENRNLLRLFKINDIRQERVDRTIKIEFGQFSGPTKVVIWESDMNGTMQINECFQMNRTGQNITVGSNCTGYMTSPINQFVFKFRFIKPDAPRLIFGDIKYNIKMKYSSDTTCKSPDFEMNDSIKDYSNEKAAALHYFRTNDSLDENNHVVHTSATGGTFYQSCNLEDIKDVWKTGFAFCKSSGRLAPHRDGSIDVPCIL